MPKRGAEGYVIENPGKRRRTGIVKAVHVPRPLAVTQPRSSRALRVANTLLSDSFKQTHVYAENTLNLATSVTQDAISVYRFSANGMYDPNITGTGHQPVLFDQLAAIYDHYVVLGAQIKVRVNNTSTEGAFCCLRVNDSTTAPTATRAAWVEQGHGKVVYCNGRSSGGSDSSAEMTLWVTPAKFLGRANPLSDPELKGSAVSNPTEQCYFDIGYGLTSSGAVAVNLDVMVTITYYARWIERKPLAQS